MSRRDRERAVAGPMSPPYPDPQHQLRSPVSLLALYLPATRHLWPPPATWKCAATTRAARGAAPTSRRLGAFPA
jgi:hypothetical protein